MAQAPKILVITEKSQSALMEYIRLAASMRDDGWNLRARLESSDKAYQREVDYTEEQRKAQAANRAGNPTKLQNMIVPMVMESVENSAAFLTNVFLLEYPMFKFAGKKDTQELALMWNTLVGEDQIYYGWAGQLNMAFRNGEKYNFAPIEIDWKKGIRYKVMNGNGPNGAVLEETVSEGNCIKALDPYNTIYDARVPIYKCHIEGEFAGYIEQLTRTQLKRKLASFGEARLKNDVRAFTSAPWEIMHYIPNINPQVATRNKNYSDGSFNWMAWANDSAQDHIAYQDLYTCTTLYARIMPFEFGIRGPRDQTPDIWKLFAVNSVLCYAEPLINAHDYLPIILGQPFVDNLDHQTKATAENIQPFQEMVSALWNAKLASARRRVSDRMLYNPVLVDPDHINSPNPSAKIPVRPTAYGRKLEEAVYQIPFNDENSQYFLQEANGVAEWGLRAQGQNRVSVGQFQKGNKLQDEFATTMANAGARERTKAIMWEVNVMHPIKEIIKSNYLQFAPSGEKYNRYEKMNVNIDPVALRKASIEFQTGDGLLPVEKLVHADVMQQGFNTMVTVPGIAAEYELGDLFAYMMKLQGVDRLDQFRKSSETMQWEKQMQVWQNTAALMAKEGKTVEEIQKAIGAMPKPPEQQQAEVNPNSGVPSAYLTP